MDVTPSIILSSAAVAETKVPPNFNPLDVSCEAILKSIEPSAIVTFWFSSMDIAGFVPTVLPCPIIKSSAESSSPI